MAETIARRLAGSADEIPFAPSEGFVLRREIGMRELGDHLRLREPLLVGAALVMGHHRESIELLPEPARQPIFGDPVSEGQKGSTPRFDDHYAAARAKDAAHLGKGLLEIVGQIGQMVQAALHDENVFALVGEGEAPAVAHSASGRAFVLREQAWGEIDALQMPEAKPMQRMKAVAAAAK